MFEELFPFSAAQDETIVNEIQHVAIKLYQDEMKRLQQEHP